MITATLLALAAATAAEPSVLFERRQIGDTTYEAASIFDVNNDGHLDLVSGG